MSEHFEVGEIAIYVRPGSPYYGQEVEVLSCLIEDDESTDVITGETLAASWGFVYQITDLYPDTPGLMTAHPEWLRKKKPPRRDIDQKVSWNDCIWKPAGVTA